MDLIFEKSVKGRKITVLPGCDVPLKMPESSMLRAESPKLPELSELDVTRHYSALEKRARGVNNVFYPLGSCTMKYNPRVNEAAASLEGFTAIHPLQPADTVIGCVEVLLKAEEYLCEITGMDKVTFQPAAGAHGELTGMMLIKKYHEARGDSKRNTVIVPDSAHGTNPATAAMLGMKIINIKSRGDGCVDLEALKANVNENTAGVMLTNPNTLGIFEKDIKEITKIVHDAGGLAYYDGANLNAVMGVIRPGDMGFDCIHLNLHKTFSTPHGGGGPGSGAVGCKEFLAKYLPVPHQGKNGMSEDYPQSIGKVKSFYGNFLVTLKALAYIMTLGREGIKEAANYAVLNANYMMKQLSECYETATDGACMHEFVLTLEKLKKEYGASALDVAKALIDNDIHPPTIYFPLIVHEAMMFEPTETESKETLDKAISVMKEIYKAAITDSEKLHEMPLKSPVGRTDEVGAARNPVLRYSAPAEQ